MFACDMITYKENPRESTKKFLESICNYSYSVGYKVNVQVSGIQHFEPDNIYISNTKMKYLGINPTEFI